MTKHSNILITNGSILARNGWTDLGYLWSEGGIIQEIGIGEPSTELAVKADEIIDARYCAVLPGLDNAHTHLSQTFMRGLAGGRPLINWLKEVIWPIQGTISAGEIYLAALLGLVENLRCGAIWVTDHHKITATSAHTEAVLKAAREIGLRFTLARAWSDRGKIPESPESILADLRRLFDQTKDDDRLDIANGPLALWRCSAETLQVARALALDNGAVTHFHVSESQDEVQMSLDEYGLRPVEWLDSIGVLGPDTQIVHAVWVDEVEMALIATGRAPVIHCPVSNAVLGSGVAPVAKMLAHSIEIRLGTDGPASNDTQDIWETLKSAVSFARATTLDPTVLPPSQALRLATRGRVLKVKDPADLIIVNLDHSRVVPVQDIDSALVLGTHGSDMETVIVGGEILLRAGKVTILDEA
ncbi:MAG: amidohydrolase family protein, partial [Anaerolineales bacterium]|nr:amidohydrolase family protein [Anaerolineales bacterium]